MLAEDNKAALLELREGAEHGMPRDARFACIRTICRIGHSTNSTYKLFNHNNHQTLRRRAKRKPLTRSLPLSSPLAPPSANRSSATLLRMLCSLHTLVHIESHAQPPCATLVQKHHEYYKYIEKYQRFIKQYKLHVKL